jgi:hypothetical protein
MQPISTLATIYIKLKLFGLNMSTVLVLEVYHKLFHADAMLIHIMAEVYYRNE